MPPSKAAKASPKPSPIPQRTKDKVLVCGFADTRRSIPADDDGFEFWGLNALHRSPDVPKAAWSRWFQLHDIQATHGKDPADLEDHLRFLRSLDCPVYLRPQDVGKFAIPSEQPFPIAEVTSKFPPYFNNTVSYLLALAILMEFEELHLYGVDMATDSLLNSEYAHQRPSCEFFLGLAAGKGMAVEIPQASDLLKATHLYGFEDPDAWTAKLQGRLDELTHRRNQMRGQLAQTDQQRAETIAGINQIEGAIQDVTYWLRNWAPQPTAGKASV